MSGVTANADGPVVGLVRRAVVVVALGDDEDVVAAAERVAEHGARAQEDVRVVALSLVLLRAVKVPLLQVLDRIVRAVERLRRQRARGNEERTVVLQRRPPSPSALRQRRGPRPPCTPIQMYSAERQNERREERRTSLDLVSLRSVSAGPSCASDGPGRGSGSGRGDPGGPSTGLHAHQRC